MREEVKKELQRLINQCIDENKLYYIEKLSTALKNIDDTYGFLDISSQMSAMLEDKGFANSGGDTEL